MDSSHVGCHSSVYNLVIILYTISFKKSPIYHDIKYYTASTLGEYKSDFKIAKDTPYLALAGEHWVVYYEIWEKMDHVIKASHCMLLSHHMQYIFFKSRGVSAPNVNKAVVHQTSQIIHGIERYLDS